MSERLSADVDHPVDPADVNPPVDPADVNPPVDPADVDHRALAVALFNHVWTLLEMEDRTREQDDQMLHAAHASRHHWGVVGAPVNLAGANGNARVSTPSSVEVSPRSTTVGAPWRSASSMASGTSTSRSPTRR